jgi:hypothetical protein
MRGPASVTNIGSVYCEIADFLSAHPLPTQPSDLLVGMPDPDWEWLQGSPPAFRERYVQGLNAFACQVARACGSECALTVVPRRSDAWQLLFDGPDAEAEAAAPQAAETRGGHFIAPDADYPLLVIWPHPEDPRVPSRDEQTAEDSGVEEILSHLLPVEATDRRWRVGGVQTVCNRPVWFYRPGRRRGKGGRS